MSKYQVLLQAYVKRLGLEPQVATIYHALQQHGPQTISELARRVKLDRIRIYRSFDQLKESGLVEFEVKYKRTILHAAPLSQLQVLLARREQELKDLQQEYELLSKYSATQTIRSQATRVQFYEGMEGIKQMLWTQTKAKGESVALLYDNMQHKTNLAFFERWVRTCNEKNLAFRGIIGQHFIETQQQWYGEHTNERLANWTSRYIPDEAFPIPYSMVVFDDVVLNYDWNDQRMFGIEIRDAKIAAMQRQFFEMLWQKAIPVNDLVGIKKGSTVHPGKDQ